MQTTVTKPNRRLVSDSIDLFRETREKLLQLVQRPWPKGLIENELLELANTTLSSLKREEDRIAVLREMLLSLELLDHALPEAR